MPLTTVVFAWDINTANGSKSTPIVGTPASDASTKDVPDPQNKSAIKRTVGSPYQQQQFAGDLRDEFPWEPVYGVRERPQFCKPFGEFHAPSIEDEPLFVRSGTLK